MIKHLDITVFGQVQGVSFRWFCVLKATGLGLTGRVRNQPDGTVYIEAEGDKEPLDLLLAWCHHGPPWAKVVKLEVKSGPVKNIRGFSVRR